VGLKATHPPAFLDMSHNSPEAL